MSEFAYGCRDDLEYIIVDPAQGMLKYAKTYMKTCKAYAESLPFEDKSTDIVLMGEALHHFSDVDKALKETKRVLKKNGSLFIYDFDVGTFRGKTISSIENLFGEPANFFEPEALLVHLESYGFLAGFKRHGWRYTMHAQLK
jgi:demethylmenaquinone methyltransferase/2-methoxy-6-polyprenyl-1,4-benzoquinol methylase